MTRLITTALAAFALSAAVASTASASGIQTINCEADRANAAERTICASQSLQILDAKVTEVYADMMSSRRISRVVKANIRESQYSFLARRNACGHDRGCLAEVMSVRLTRIHYYL